HVGELDIHLTTVAPVVEKILGAAPPGTEVVLGPRLREPETTGTSARPERADPQVFGGAPERVGQAPAVVDLVARRTGDGPRLNHAPRFEEARQVLAPVERRLRVVAVHARHVDPADVMGKEAIQRE